MHETSAVEALVRASHLIVPDDVPSLVDEHARALGATRAVVHVVDLDQRMLVPLHVDGTLGAGVAIDGTLAGRCYRTVSMVEGTAGDRILWAPVVDGTDRLGVLQLTVPEGIDLDRDLVAAFAGLVAELIMSKSSYGDFFERARRNEPISIAAELLWQLLPPLTFGTDDLVITGSFIPTEDLGGDAFDYAVDARCAQVAIFDALGHGLGAGLIATTAVAAYRNGRRGGLGIEANADRIGESITAEFGHSRFATGVLATLERATGQLSWCIAGHPPPLLLRAGHVVKSLDADPGMPLGVGPASPVAHEQLEPGDRVLLYTDGVVEARTASGDFFGVERLTELIARSGDEPPPEMMRRLMHALEAHNDGPMRDDATVVMIEWRGGGAQKLQLT